METTEQGFFGIIQLLIREKLLQKEEALIYQQAAQKEKLPLLHYLVLKKILDAKKIASLAAYQFGLPFQDLDAIDLETIPLELVHEKLIRLHHVIPLFHRGHHLSLAIDDPSNDLALKEIQYHTGCHTHPVVVEADKLIRCIDTLLNAKNKKIKNLQDFMDPNEIDTHLDEEEIKADNDSEDLPIIQLVHKILQDAIKNEASDIHFEPYEHYYRIRYRQDGVLTEIINPPLAWAGRICARIKIMSGLDISERRLPQDGRFKRKISSLQTIDCRVSTCPTLHGEKVVIRLLDFATMTRAIETLGMDDLQEQQFLQAIERPQGMILVTGPTGSGKTITLYSAINILNSTEKNISTVEDPVEIKIAGINQVTINSKAGLGFAEIIRSFLRQDPDILMVGEIRDLETAEIAVKASQTGHLVLSTLHTNSAAETLTRLEHLGIPGFQIADSVHLIIAQRLVRRLCEHCKIPHSDFDAQTLMGLGFPLQELAKANLFKAQGCEQCWNGYKGRIGLFEVMPLSKTMAQMIRTGQNSLQLLEQAKNEGMVTMHQSGIKKMLAGLTTLEEVKRITVE